MSEAFKKSHAHLPCVFNNSTKFEECSLTVREELITQSRYHFFKIHRSKTYVVQPSQRSKLKSKQGLEYLY
jgi:hypothetical protein